MLMQSLIWWRLLRLTQLCDRSTRNYFETATCVYPFFWSCSYFRKLQSTHYILLVISHVYMICGCTCSDLFTMLMVNKLSEPRIIVTMLIRTTTLKLILKATILDRGIETVLLICRTLFSIIWAPAAAQRVHLSACQWRFWSAGIRYDRWSLPEKWSVRAGKDFISCLNGQKEKKTK